MALLRGRLEAGGRRAFVRLGGAAVEVGPLPDALRRAWDAREVIAGLRAEHLTLATPDDGSPATVEAVEVLGASNLVHVSLDGAPPESPRVVVRVEPAVRPGPGTAVRVMARPARVHLFDPDDERSFWHGQT
jgi:ABC-type sugar transport system ATPase subunit